MEPMKKIVVEPLVKPVSNEDLDKRLKRIETSTHIQTALLILGFIGIITLGSLVAKGKEMIKFK